MSAPTIDPATITGTAPIPKASREHECGSPWACGTTVAVGEPAGYVGVQGQAMPVLVCDPCLQQVKTALAAQPVSAATPEPEPALAPESWPAAPSDSTDGWEMTGPEDLVAPPPEKVDLADTNPWDGPLCGCPNRSSGFARDPKTERWVHTGCGRPALRHADGRTDGTATSSAGQPIESPLVTEVVDPTDRAAAAARAEWLADQAGCPLEPAAPVDETAGNQPDADQAGALSQVSTPSQVDESAGNQPEDDVKTCPCQRVTKRASFHRDASGRPVHDNCGGLVRDKHMALAVEKLGPAHADETAATNQDEEQSDDAADSSPHAESAFDGEPDADPGADPGAGEPSRPADGAARTGEEGSDGREEGGRRADGLDQGRGVPAGPGGHDGADHPQPVDEPAVEGGATRGVADRLEAAQGGAPRDLGGVREEDRQLPTRRDEVAPPQALGGLAAFYAQPADEDDGPVAITTLDWSLLADDETTPTSGTGPPPAPDGRPVEQSATITAEVAAQANAVELPGGGEGAPLPLSDVSMSTLLAEVGRRTAGLVTALIVRLDGEEQPRVYEVPR